MRGKTPADQFVGDVYDELRGLAARYVQREQTKSVQATELVHEAYLRLANEKRPQWRNRTHFIAIAAIAMRRLLVERARARHASKRGGKQVQITLDEALLAGGNPDEREALDVLALDAALTKLAAFDASQAQIVELRFFGGLSVDETAEAMGLSPATIKRHWAVARAWLLREIEGPAPSGAGGTGGVEG
jgi:RNA polymerase sigma factor (TIGR02999 family)